MSAVSRKSVIIAFLLTSSSLSLSSSSSLTQDNIPYEFLLARAGEKFLFFSFGRTMGDSQVVTLNWIFERTRCFLED
jgi:hypothetical protein